MTTSFANTVESACDEALIDVGFKRPRKGTRYLEITKDFLGWVGLNKGRHAQFLRINPFVGVHCVPIMKLCDELEGIKYLKGQIATVAVHLGEICPEEEEFVFRPDEPIEQEALRLSATVHKHGVPWMMRHANYGGILPLMKEKTPALGGYPERVAVAYYLMGKEDQARNFIAEQRAKLEAEHQEYRPFFERVAEPLLSLMAS